MRRFKEILKTIPVIPAVYRALRNRYAGYRMKAQSVEDVFTGIYSSKGFGGKESVSGPGSDLDQTRVITRELPAVLRALGISTMLDIPCGDFYWMTSVDLRNIDYIGADIVKELVQDNSARYAREGVRFQYLNLMRDKLPKADLVLCRDCLVHLSFEDSVLALKNICSGEAKYLLTTTFTGRKENLDIVTGGWRPLNLELVPFALPKPLKVINEGCSEGNGAYEDKALGLWRIADLRESLSGRSR